MRDQAQLQGDETVAMLGAVELCSVRCICIRPACSILTVVNVTVENVALVGKYGARRGAQVEVWRSSSGLYLRLCVVNPPDASQAVHVLQQFKVGLP